MLFSTLVVTPQAAVKFSKNLKASKNSSISVYSKIPASEDINEALDEPKSLKRFCAFVEIKSDMETPLYIRKSTAVWLFQEGERISSDRLLRVKAKQPFCSTSKYDSDNTGMDNTVPFVATQLKTGDICIFKTICLNWNIGKVQSFCKLKGKKIKEQEYKQYFADLSMPDIRVLCAWFSQCESAMIFDSMPSTVDERNINHSYIPISKYICTLTRNCFDIISGSSATDMSAKSITTSVTHQQEILMAKKIRITEKCQTLINDLMLQNEKLSGSKEIHELENPVAIIESDVEAEELDEGSSNVHVWTAIENTRLNNFDKEILLNKDECLNDKHIMCGQLLIKKAFPHIGGLLSTLQQQKNIVPLQSKSLQIVHLPGHWICVSTMNCENEDIVLYDSSSLNINEHLKWLLSKLVCTQKPQFTVRIACLAKQSANSDCGLYAIGYITHLAFGLDPSLFVLKQQALRSHFIHCIEQKTISPFPILREHRQPSTPTVVTIEVHCHCRCPDTGSKMVFCDGPCRRWYHFECLNAVTKTAAMKKKKWFCDDCSRK